jgi:hypothetical protein
MPLVNDSFHNNFVNLSRSFPGRSTNRHGLMNRMRIIRLIGITLLALSAYWGFTNGPREIRTTASVLQKAVGVGQILYALAAVLGLLALWFRPGWAVRAAIVWALILTVTVVVATIAWSAPLRGALAASGVAAAVAAFAVWLIRAGVQQEPDQPPT